MSKQLRYIKHPLLQCMLYIYCVATTFGQQEHSALQLTLPPRIEAIIDVPMRVYFDNIVLTEIPHAYRFEISCPVGVQDDRCWTLSAEKKDVGQHPLEVKVFDSSDSLVASGSSVLRVCDDRAIASAEPMKLLIIGDSLTHASAYPNEIARLLTRSGCPDWRMLGTHRPTSAAEGVCHEGYGGWTWQRFVSHYEPKPDVKQRKHSSPFVYLDQNAKPTLNLPKYFDEACDAERPNYVVIMLGINDCFGANPDEASAIDARIDSMFEHADRLLAAIREAAPKATIGVCLTTPPNNRQEAFSANYGDRYSRWGWKRIQHRLVQRQIEHIEAKSDPQIEIIPTELNLDPTNGYPDNNAVHPNTAGYQQIGATIFTWLACQPGKQSTSRTD
ncbi:MAG: SGNH/GDSL hydrolase family protein [Pirellulaceae bacterium]